MRRLNPALFAIAAVALVPAACQTVPTGGAEPTPTLAPYTRPGASRPPLLIQYCDDDTGSYPRQYFGRANQLVAASLVEAVTANQQGVTLYATAITRNTFDPANTLDPAFVVPAIDPYPSPPTPVPTQPSEGPVIDPPTETAVARQDVQDIADYNQRVAAKDRLVQTTKAAVTKDTARLTSWNPTIDAKATSILGCLQLAASRFQGQPGVKLLYIASDMENNTDVDYTQDFVSSHALSGVIVHVIYFYSQTAARDREKRAAWCPYLEAAGASAVRFSIPVDRLDDIFDSDLKAPAATC